MEASDKPGCLDAEAAYHRRSGLMPGKFDQLPARQIVYPFHWTCIAGRAVGVTGDKLGNAILDRLFVHIPPA
jgi:hypothetical protein